ncbi:MAG: hypothetical protein ACREAA_20145 [Candidatus Polarisedimenticolia bacterium]
MKPRFVPSLVLALTLMGAVSACGLRKPLPEGAELIPADATFAISLDVPSLLNSRLYELYKSRESAFGLNRLNFYKFAEATGIDPSKDVQRVMFLATAGDDGLREMSGVAMGTFDGRKVYDFLKDSGLPSQKVAGMDIFEVVVLDGRCRFCIGVVDASTAIFGDGETLEKVAQVKSGSKPGLSAEERAGRLLRRMGRDPEGWGIVRAEDLRGAIGGVLGGLNQANALAALGPIREVSFSFDDGEPIRALVEMTAATDEDAMRVADILKGAESLGRLALKETSPDLGRLMSDLVIEADTGIVRAAGSIPSSDVDNVARLLGGKMGGLMGFGGAGQPTSGQPDPPAGPDGASTP